MARNASPRRKSEAQQNTPEGNTTVNQPNGQIINFAAARLGVETKWKLLGTSALPHLQAIKEMLNGTAAAEALASSFQFLCVVTPAEVTNIAKANESYYNKRGRKPADENMAAHTVARMSLAMSGLLGTGKAPLVTPLDGEFSGDKLNDRLLQAQAAVLSNEQASNQVYAYTCAFKLAQHRGFNKDTPFDDLVTFFSEGIYVLRGRYFAEIGNPAADAKREESKRKREERKAERQEPERQAAAERADAVIHQTMQPAASPEAAAAAVGEPEGDIQSESIMFSPDGSVEAAISKTAWEALRKGVGGEDGAILCRVSFLNGDRNAIKLEAVAENAVLTVPKLGGGLIRVSTRRPKTINMTQPTDQSGGDDDSGGQGGQAA